MLVCLDVDFLLLSVSYNLLTGGGGGFDIVFNAKSPCNMGKAEDDIKPGLSMAMRFGDHGEGSSIPTQCDVTCGIKSNCRSDGLLFTLDVIQLTRFLFDFIGCTGHILMEFFQLVDCSSFSLEYDDANGFSFFGVLFIEFVDRMSGISKDDENNGS